MTKQGPTLTRRAALIGAGALPLMAAARAARASAPMQGAGHAPFNRIGFGGFEITTILAASSKAPKPQNFFGTNVSADVFAMISEQNNLPTERLRFFFTPTVINTGTQLILFDTGLSAKGTTRALAAAGYAPEQVDLVVISHMHGDHIGGLMDNGAPTYANASYVAGAVDFDAFDKSGDRGFAAKMKPLADRTRFIDDGDSVAPGITAMAAFGHTPGHMTFLIDSGGRQLLLAVDFANHYVWSLAHPDWQMRFDTDKDAAAATRHRILKMLSAEKMPFIGYHMPWPALGYVEAGGDGYRYVPHSYQLTL